MQQRRFVLAAFTALLLMATVVSAQVTYRITSTPTFVANVGRSEIIGNVRFTATNTTASIGSTLDIFYQGIGCDNLAGATGVLVLTSGAYAGAGAATVAGVVNSATGCVVSIQVAAALAAAAGDFIEVQGVRGRVDLSPAGAPRVGVDIEAALNATPSGSSLFTAPSIVRVATSQTLRTVTTTPQTYASCVTPAANPSVTVREDYNGAFVQHIASTALTPIPAAARAPNGQANANTRIVITATASPTGVTLTWPATVDAAPFEVAAPAPNLAFTRAGAAGSVAVAFVGGASDVSARLERIGLATGTTITYEFVSAQQGQSDITIESFVIIPVVALAGAITPGTVSVQARVQPGLITSDATAVSSAVFGAGAAFVRPRYNDPLSPAATLLTVGPCATYLLFPWVVFNATANFDTGMAIVNTTADVFGTVAQTGTVTFTFYPSPATMNDVVPAPIVVTPANAIRAGEAITLLASGSVPAGFSGYCIAKANFQFAHGFAYITDGFGLAAPRTAEAYLALIIPDPVVTQAPLGLLAAARVAAGSAIDAVLGATSGEGLKH